MPVVITVTNPDGKVASLGNGYTYVPGPPPPPPLPGSHGYFNMLVARPEHWKSNSFRTQALINANSNKGVNSWVTYDPAMDAAKAVIPPFFASTKLTTPLAAADTMITVVNAAKTLYPPGRTIKIDTEIMTVVQWLSLTTVQVTRAAFGTPATTHANGVSVWHATNSLQNQVRFPLGTQDGHSYFFVWDALWTATYLGVNFTHKAFQLSCGPPDGDSIWFEPRTRFGMPPAVAHTDVRSYNFPGGGADWSLTGGNTRFGGSGDALTATAPFAITTNTWTRYFLRIVQRANDYDVVDMWLADATRDPVQTLTNSLVSVRPAGPTPHSIAKFWLEKNSSTDTHLRLDQRDFVSYVRNFVALRDVANIQPLLVRP